MNHKKKRSAADDLVNSLLDETQHAGKDASDQETVDQTVNLQRLRKVPENHPSLDETAAVTSGRGSNDDEEEKDLGSTELALLETQLMASQSPENEDVRFGRITPEKKVRLGGASSAVESSLSQSENLRIAQERILDLEKEVHRLRTENEQLMAAGETLRQRADDLISRADKAQIDLQDEKETAQAEKKILQDNLSSKDKELARLRHKIDELELRLESDLKKIRVRERDLENRIELMKMEEAALQRSKDDIILDLKRRIDQLTTETDNYRNRGLELHKQIEADQDRFRRTVRALRLALTMLEDNQSDTPHLKKAE